MNAVMDRPTIAERYSVACETSNLKVREHWHPSNDADVIIAAGWLRNKLGALLLRLHQEFDTVRGDVAAAQYWSAIQNLQALELKRAAFMERCRADFNGDLGPTRAPLLAARLDKNAEKIEEDSARHLKAEFAMAMVQMKTLRQAKEALGQLAVIAATKRRLMIDDAAVFRLADAVLELHLTPNCTGCGGRKMVGVIYRGEAQTICRACNGSGNRRAVIGKDHSQREFCAWLLSEMEVVLGRAMSRMRRHLSNRTV